MKKLIAILVVMIAIVGAVFATNSNDAKTADGTAQIKVQATVTEAVPQFQLAVKTGDTAVGTIAKDAVEYGSWTTGENPTLNAGAVDAATTKLTTTSINKLTGNGGETAADVTVQFVINQVAKANLKANYKITVTATNLKLTKYSDGTVPANNYAHKSTEQFVVDDGTPTVTASSTVKIDNIDAITFDGTTGTDNILKLQYTGNAQVDASTASAVELGHFDVKWQKNETAVAGDYEATVEIVVESV